MTTFARKKAPSQPGGDPTVATLLTWFMPGAGHFYIGRTTFAMIAFVVVEGLYLLGLKLSGGMGFEFLQEELRGLLAPGLAPEAGNLGGLLYQIRTYGFGLGVPRPFPEYIVLGSILTALSGVANVILMCHVHFEARLPKGTSSRLRSPAWPVLLTWLVPGLGHFQQRRKLRGTIIFVMLVGLLVIGTLLADSSNLSRERHYYYWGGQLMAGLPALGLQFLWGAKLVTSHITYGEAGLVIASLAGMLNILAMLDVYAWGERSAQGEPQGGDAARETEASQAGIADATAASATEEVTA